MRVCTSIFLSLELCNLFSPEMTCAEKSGEEGEHRQPRLAPEAGAALDHRLRRLRGDEEALRVRRAEAVSLVQIAEAPVVVRHSLRAKGRT